MERRVKAVATVSSSSHMWFRQNDHRQSEIIGVYRDSLGKAMGSVQRPVTLSPMTSRKSCAWIVVARIAVMMTMDSAPGKSSLVRF